MLVYDSLSDLLQWWAPDALDMSLEWHSHEACTINLLAADLKYTVWLATLSLDQRWTLSPRHGPWQGEWVVVEQGELG
jgi:hypothetical protein